ncbi:MAG: response regulator transcription factor [Gammaproteobacteria bacterium]|nr:response regulator transcription factor [Gammaproteobacteria bacterium]
MNVLIVDDESPARKRLNRLIGEIDGFEAVGEAKNGQEAIDQCDVLKPDIVLMDIRMPAVDGLDAAKKITQQKSPPAIIYCTAYSDHALQAFESHAVDYLLKPVNKERLVEALIACTKVSRAQQANVVEIEEAEEKAVRQHICARVRGNLVLVPVESIYYFHADQKYINVKHSEGELLIEETLLSLESEFSEGFLRIHRNALVSKERIDGLVKNETTSFVTFKGIDDQLEISRRHLPAVRKAIKTL